MTIKIQPNWIAKKQLSEYFHWSNKKINNNDTLVRQECAENGHFCIFPEIQPKEIIIALQ